MTSNLATHNFHAGKKCCGVIGWKRDAGKVVDVGESGGGLKIYVFRGEDVAPFMPPFRSIKKRHLHRNTALMFVKLGTCHSHGGSGFLSSGES